MLKKQDGIPVTFGSHLTGFNELVLTLTQVVHLVMHQIVRVNHTSFQTSLIYWDGLPGPENPFPYKQDRILHPYGLTPTNSGGRAPNMEGVERRFRVLAGMGIMGGSVESRLKTF